MTIAELEELCAQVTNKDMEVFIGDEESIVGGWIFKPACLIESGVTGLPAPDDVDGTGPIEEQIFALMPCGQQCAAQNGGDEEDDEDAPPAPEVFN